MSRDDAHKLLGGYATGTLTAEEERALFEAALQDQELFDALAREQALRDLLDDPAARAQLLMAVDEAPAPWHRRWWRLAPVVAMAAAIAVVAVVELPQNSRTRLLPRAKLQAPAVAAQPAPILPPPPELARAAPAAPAPFSLPGAAPASPPPPPPPTAQAAVPASSSAGSLAPPPLAQQAFGASPPPPAVPPPFGAAPPSAPRAFRPLSGAGPPVLATTESVTVAAASQPVAVSSSGAVTATPTPRQLADLPPAARDAQTLFYGAGQGANLRGTLAAPQGFVAAAGQILAPAPANLGIQYRVLRRMPDGDFVDVEADGSVAAGTAVKLEITPNNNGYLRVLESQPNGARREVVNRPVERMKPLETDLLRYQETGRRELQVAFSRQPFQASPTAEAAAKAVHAVKQDVATATVTAGLGGATGSGGRGGRGGGGGGGDAVLSQPRVSFAANRDASADAVSVTITLNIR